MDDDVEETKESPEALLGKVENYDYHNDKSWSEALHAAASLGELKDARAVRPLLDMLALEHLEFPALHDNKLPYCCDSILRALENIGEAAVPELCWALWEWKNFSTHRDTVADILAKIGSNKAAEAAMDLLTFEGEFDEEIDAEIRATGASLLGSVGDRDCVDRLNTALNDESEIVQRCAKQALNELVERKVISQEDLSKYLALVDE